MENYVSAQLGQLGAAVALGAAGGLVYDLLRAARLIDRHDSWLTHLLDDAQLHHDYHVGDAHCLLLVVGHENGGYLCFALNTAYLLARLKAKPCVKV